MVFCLVIRQLAVPQRSLSDTVPWMSISGTNVVRFSGFFMSKINIIAFIEICRCLVNWVDPSTSVLPHLLILIKGILPKGPYLPCISMAGRTLLRMADRALLAGYPQYVGHYSDIIISAMVSQITAILIVHSNYLFRCRSKKTSKLRVTGLCEGNSPVTGEFPTQRASNKENVPISWRHHAMVQLLQHHGNWNWKAAMRTSSLHRRGPNTF